MTLVAICACCINYSNRTYESRIEKQNAKINELRADKLELEQQIITLQQINGELAQKVENQKDK